MGISPPLRQAARLTVDTMKHHHSPSRPLRQPQDVPTRLFSLPFLLLKSPVVGSHGFEFPLPPVTLVFFLLPLGQGHLYALPPSPAMIGVSKLFRPVHYDSTAFPCFVFSSINFPNAPQRTRSIRISVWGWCVASFQSCCLDYEPCPSPLHATFPWHLHPCVKALLSTFLLFFSDAIERGFFDWRFTFSPQLWFHHRQHRASFFSSELAEVFLLF